MAVWAKKLQQGVSSLLIRPGLTEALSELAERVNLVIIVETQSFARRQAILAFFKNVPKVDVIFGLQSRIYDVERVYQRYTNKSFLFVTWQFEEFDFGPLPYALAEDELLVLCVPHLC